MITEIKSLEEDVWNIPFSTPMAQAAFGFAGRVIASGQTGGVIYAPSRTGKTWLLKMCVERAQSIKGLRNNCFESKTLAIEAVDRLVISEGGFWTWLLAQVHHREAFSRNGPALKRHLALEYFKGLAQTIRAGRVVLFVDEAQHLTLVELGWFADLFNAMEKDGFRLVLFLVGSYHLQNWKADLQGKAHAHIRARFFSQEWPLSGVATLDNFRKCLDRYDQESAPFGGVENFTSHFQPIWYKRGGRLADYAYAVRDAFGTACGKHAKFEVPMEYFALTVRQLLDRPPLDYITRELLDETISGTGFSMNYDPGPIRK